MPHEHFVQIREIAPVEHARAPPLSAGCQRANLSVGSRAVSFPNQVHSVNQVYRLTAICWQRRRSRTSRGLTADRLPPHDCWLKVQLRCSECNPGVRGVRTSFHIRVTHKKDVAMLRATVSDNAIYDVLARAFYFRGNLHIIQYALYAIQFANRAHMRIGHVLSFFSRRRRGNRLE